MKKLKIDLNYFLKVMIFFKFIFAKIFKICHFIFKFRLEGVELKLGELMSYLKISKS